MAILSAGINPILRNAKERTLQSQQRRLSPGRDHLGILGDFIPESRAKSNRNGMGGKLLVVT
jgi:hypothetical protein